MLTSQQVQAFHRDGYVIIDGFFPDADLRQFREAYRHVIRAALRRAQICGAQIEPTAFDEREFDAGMMALEAHDHAYVAEIYDTTAQMTSFLRLITGGDMDVVINQLMSRPTEAPLYGFTNRCRIDLPRDDRRTYGWHQEVFYTIPESRFVQTWAPLIRPTTSANGTIEVCVGSHKEGVARQSWQEPAGRALQIIVDEALVAKYPQVQLPMTPGQLLVFDSHLFHRSGQNSSSEVRYSLVGMYHDVDNPTFHPPGISFHQRNQSARDYFVRTMQERGWPV
jgi:phytanoyl-CoA hydroxylase